MQFFRAAGQEGEERCIQGHSYRSLLGWRDKLQEGARGLFVHAQTSTGHHQQPMPSQP